MTRLILTSIATSPSTRSTSTLTYPARHGGTRIISCGRGLQSVSVAATVRYLFCSEGVVVRPSCCVVEQHVCEAEVLVFKMKIHLRCCGHGGKPGIHVGRHAKLSFLVGDVHSRKRQKWARRGRSQTGRCSLLGTPTSSYRGQRACLVLECFRHTQGEYTTLRVSIRLSPSRKCFKRVLALAMRVSGMRECFQGRACGPHTRFPVPNGRFQACAEGEYSFMPSVLQSSWPVGRGLAQQCT